MLLFSGIVSDKYVLLRGFPARELVFCVCRDTVWYAKQFVCPESHSNIAIIAKALNRRINEHETANSHAQNISIFDAR